MVSRLPEHEIDETFRTLLQCTSAAVVALDLEGRVVAWSRGAIRIFGWEEEEVLGERLPVLTPEQEDDFREQMETLREGRPVDALERRHRRRDGSLVDVRLSVHPVLDQGGDVTGVLALVTEREGSESEAPELARRLRTLEDQVAELELRALHEGLPARFMLNCLNAVSVLLRKDEGERAVRTLSRIGRMLRHVVAAGDRERVPVKEELAFVEEYVAVESLRFGGGLGFEARMEPAVRERPVPSLVLLPLVEQAVRRAVASPAEGSIVRVEAFRREGELWIEVGRGAAAASSVRPDGAGGKRRGAEPERDAIEGGEIASGAPEGGEPADIASIHRRLSRFPGASLEVERNGAGGGAVARLRFPLRDPPDEDDEPSRSRPASNGEETT